jgi:hypothetical protein
VAGTAVGGTSVGLTRGVGLAPQLTTSKSITINRNHLTVHLLMND